MKTFCFTGFDIQDIKNKRLNLNNDKASQVSDIPIKVIKDNMYMIVNLLCKNISNAFKSALLPSCLKSTSVIPLYKKGKKDLKENYRPVRLI